MARIIFETGDICKVEDNVESGWNPTSVDELTVTLEGPAGQFDDYWHVRCEATNKKGLIHERYLTL